MTHLRISIVSGTRPSATLLAHLMMSCRHHDVLIVSLHPEHTPVNAELIALELVRADISIPRIQTGIIERATIPEISLKDVLVSIKTPEEFILLRREPLPRPPKSIRPKGSARKHSVQRYNTPRYH